MAEEAVKDQMDEAPRLSKLKQCQIEAKVKVERILESEPVEKVKNTATSVGKGFAETCGFLTWELGGLFRPLRRKLRSRIEKYKSEVGN